MPSDPVIRTAVTDDASAILECWRQADAAPSVSDDLPSIERLLAHDPGAILVAQQDDRIVGTVIASWDGWRGGLYRLAVTPKARRAGLATRLVEAAEERLRGLGAPKVAALVLREHLHAQAFWRATGYELDEGLDRWTKPTS